jgi:NAD(P)-dependent dehydrogenase (short-subunit alcohol dehydrogenase family)
MEVFVIGGTGAIGGHSVPALVGAGHTVTALARTPEKAAQMNKQDASPITLSIFDRAALTGVQRARCGGQPVERVVQESASMIYPDRGATWIDEACPPDHFPMAQGNLAAEASANRFSAASGAGVVLRFGWFYGPGATQAGTADLANSYSVIEALVRHALQLDWAFAGAYRAWREAAVRDRELRVLQRQIEHWSAQQLEGLFRALLATPGARQDVDVATLAWELTLLLLRLAEISAEQPDAVEAVVASLIHLIYHALFTHAR